MKTKNNKIINKTKMEIQLTQKFGRDTMIILDKPTFKKEPDNQIKHNGIKYKIYDTESRYLFAFPDKPELFKKEEDFEIIARGIEILQDIEEYGKYNKYYQYEKNELLRNNYIELKNNNYILTSKGKKALGKLEESEKKWKEAYKKEALNNASSSSFNKNDFIFIFKSQEEVEKFEKENKLFWNVWNVPDFPAEFIIDNNNIYSVEDAKKYEPYIYEKYIGNPFQIIKPKWNGKQPYIKNIKVNVQEVAGDIVKDITANIIINGFNWKFKVGLENYNKILQKFKKEFIKQILITPKILPGVFKILENKHTNFIIDFYNENYDIRNAIYNAEDTYSKGVDINFAVFDFLMENWYDEFYGFFTSNKGDING